MSKLSDLADKLPELPEISPNTVALGLVVVTTALGQGILMLDEHELLVLDEDVKKGVRMVTRTFALALVLAKLTKERKK